MTLEARRMAESRVGRAGMIAIGAIVTILAVSGSAFVIAGANPIEAYQAYFITPLTREFTLLEALNKATPILFTGTAVAIAFRAGYWNIGVEGQLLMGAVAAAGIGQVVEGWPTLMVLPLMVAGGALAGAARIPRSWRSQTACAATGSASIPRSAPSRSCFRSDSAPSPHPWPKGST